ncbi:MAG: hypothetical protein ABI883_00975 [Chthoniobacterales bacterium]
MKRKRLLVMGFMASCPIAGVIWQHIHYIVGLQRLGHDVYYVEDSERHPYDPEQRAWLPEYEYAGRLLGRLADEFDFKGKWSFCAPYLDRESTAGLSRSQVLELYRDADAILNVCGTQEITADLLGNDRLLYIDSDPGVEQIRVDQAVDHTVQHLQAHRALFTFGENIGTLEFPVPTHGMQWLPTRQPVVTDLWRTERLPCASAVFTTIANWNTSGLKDIVWRGEKYHWNKAPQFLEMIAAPQHAGEPFEIAVEMEPALTRSAFESNGWRLSDPSILSVDCNAYREYIRASKGEFTVAKDQYVRLKTGWFSDRSASYLAAGRPVITQETGFTQHYGGGAGLFGFRSLDEAAEAVRQVNADLPFHCRAAADLAREVFEAETVLRSLLERAGI